MPTSRHRLTRSDRRRLMEPAPHLDALIARYLDHHRAYGRSAKTVSHYQDSFRILFRFVEQQSLSPTQSVLTADTFRQFATWLRTTPLERPRRGTHQRSEVGVHGVLKDLRAF